MRRVLSTPGRRERSTVPLHWLGNTGVLKDRCFAEGDLKGSFTVMLRQSSINLDGQGHDGIKTGQQFPDSEPLASSWRNVSNLAFVVELLGVARVQLASTLSVILVPPPLLWFCGGGDDIIQIYNQHPHYHHYQKQHNPQ